MKVILSFNETVKNAENFVKLIKLSKFFPTHITTYGPVRIFFICFIIFCRYCTSVCV